MEFEECTRESGSGASGAAEDRRTPCSILTGFLGAGKTTLVNHILRESGGRRIAVIENEFGEVGVDDALVLQTDEEVFEMNNGCICCTVRGDLLRIFEKLDRRGAQLDHILIETTGLADPAPVAQTFFVDAQVKASYRLDAIITVVDAQHIGQPLAERKLPGVENESVEQVAFADKLLLNKLDLVSSEQKAAVVARMRQINQFAEIIEATHAEVPVEQLLGCRAFDLSRVLQLDDEFLEVGGSHQHDVSVGSVGIEFAGAMDMHKLNNWLTALLREQGVDIFRSKGVLNMAGSDARYVFQGVHMLMSISSSDDNIGRAWRPDEPRTNRLVFIGRNLDREALISNFASCVAV